MIRRIALAALTLLGACQQPAAQPERSIDLAVAPQGTAAVQRVVLPAAAVIASRRADLGDLRLIDGRGKPVPIALHWPNAPEAVTRIALAAYPIADAANASGSGAVSINLAQPGQTVRIETVGADTAPRRPGVLLDTRAVKQPARALELNAGLPAQTPVTFTLARSTDLKTWSPLAEKVLYAPQAGAAPLGESAIALDGADLSGHFVKVSWDAQGGVSVTRAELLTADSRPAPQLIVATRSAALDDPHALHFAAPFTSPIAAVEVRAADADGVVPVTLHGRDAAERPWALLGAGTLRPGRPARIDLGGARMAEYRIEADARSAGFATPPDIRLLLAPVELIAAFNGQPPYRLTLADPADRTALFSPSELLEAGTTVPQLPAALLDQPAPPVVALGPGGSDGPFAPRKLILWGALLLGTAVLAFGAVRLMQASAANAE